MEEISKINEVGNFQRKIAENAKTKIEAGINEIKNSFEMMNDMQEIISALIKECNDRQEQIEILSNDNEHLKKNIKNAEEKIQNFEEDKERYKLLEEDAVNITEIISLLKKKQEDFNYKEQKLQDDREDFETEKKELKKSEREAQEKVEKLKKERDENVKNIDKLTVDLKNLKKDKSENESRLEKIIDEKNEIISNLEEEYSDQMSALREELEEKISNLEEENTEYEERIEDLKQDKKWFRDYAIEQDRKIFRYFDKKDKEDLKNHYKTYLNNKDKEEERRERFGDEGVFTQKSNKKEERTIVSDIEDTEIETENKKEERIDNNTEKKCETPIKQVPRGENEVC